MSKGSRVSSSAVRTARARNNRPRLTNGVKWRGRAPMLRPGGSGLPSAEYSSRALAPEASGGSVHYLMSAIGYEPEHRNERETADPGPSAGRNRNAGLLAAACGRDARASCDAAEPHVVSNTGAGVWAEQRPEPLLVGLWRAGAAGGDPRLEYLASTAASPAGRVAAGGLSALRQVNALLLSGTVVVYRVIQQEPACSNHRQVAWTSAQCRKRSCCSRRTRRAP
jgi:hypothetical protein